MPQTRAVSRQGPPGGWSAAPHWLVSLRGPEEEKISLTLCSGNTQTSHSPQLFTEVHQSLKGQESSFIGCFVPSLLLETKNDHLYGDDWGGRGEGGEEGKRG